MTQAVIPLKTAISHQAGDSLKPALVLAAQVALLAATYYLAAKLGLAFRFQNSQISVVWPANAVIVASLLLAPRARWWMVLVTVSLAHIAAMSPDTPVWRWIFQAA